MSGQDDRLSQIISEAAFDPAKWRNVCDEFARMSNAIGGLIVPVTTELRAARFPHSAELEGLLDRYQRDEWYRRDIRERGLPAVGKRGFMIDEDCIDYYAIDKSNYFQEFLKPVGMKWFAGLGFGDGPTFCVLSLQRPGSRDPFTAEEIAPLMRFRDQVNASISIARQFGFESVKAAASVLEHQGRAVIGLSAGGSVTFVSKSAETYCGDVFEVTGGALIAKNVLQRQALDRLVHSLIRPTKLVDNLKPIPLSHENGKRALVAHGCRLPEAEIEIFQPAVAFLVLIDPEKPQNIPVELLIDYFGITRAEARLAISVLNGLTLVQHAAQGGISIATARNQLQSLQSKTGTHSKAEMVAFMSRVVTP